MLHLPEFNCRVVAVAEPDEVKRKMAVESWRIPPENVFEDAEAFFRRPKFCDALVNTTQDALHVSTALAAIAHAYPMLLEKPMAVTPGDCRAIADAACRAGTVLTVCHSLRYHAT
ncbi:MAG: Gfo/Idh/MocA family oxidoreductase, partial [Opitutaceae bacterium]